MTVRVRTLLIAVTLAAFVTASYRPVRAQMQQIGATIVQQVQAYASITPISATAAVNTQTTLTIPAPPANMFNYVCYLHFNISQNATATASTNAVTTSTNFNSYAIKYSAPATANAVYDWIEVWGTPAGGCAKSTSPGTATTFVSPAAQTNSAFTWTAGYFQAQ
jgi:hypothetical protein